MEAYKTPVGGFSNGEREFGLFYVGKPQGCRQDSDCGNGLNCDPGLGYAGSKPQADEGITLACVDGYEGCSTDPMEDAMGMAVGYRCWQQRRTTDVGGPAPWACGTWSVASWRIRITVFSGNHGS
jgi:hypothetical protein